LLSGGALTGSAFAQQPAPEADRSLEEITVTGSRIRRDDFSSAQPTTVMDNQYLQNLGVINLGAAMVGVPQNVNRNSPDANAGGNFFNGSTLANLRGLNPFFGTRTLTLVDSRRHVPTNQGDGVDLNFIPTILIDRVETVTGGASASYGSGAIGGVQNILLDRDYEGIKAEIDFGASGEGDGDSTHYGVAFGTGVGETGQFVVGIEGEESDGIFKCSSSRDWCGTNTGVISNHLFAAPAGPDGRPQNLVLPGLREAWNSRTGIFWLPNGPAGSPRAPNSGAVVPSVRLNDAGNGLVSFNPGVGGDGFFQTVALGGEGEGIHEDTVIRSPVERTIAYASFTNELTDKLGFFVEASVGDTETDSEGGFTNFTNTCIRADNAYIQPSQQGGSTALLDFVTANNGAFPCLFGGVPFHKNWENQIDHGNVTSTDLTRVAFGFDGEFGDSTWTWDAYYQSGKSERVQLVRDLGYENRYNYAIDTVLNGAGQPACRSAVDPLVTTPVAVANVTNLGGRLLANPVLRNGCQPLNPFGANNLTATAKAYAFGYIRENTDVEQNMAEFVASGDIAEGFGAGSLKAAAGVSFRSEDLQNIAAEELGDAVRRDFAIQYGETFAGDVDVIEVFGELDLPLHETFSMQVAARHSEYENTAGQGTPDPGAKFDYNIDTYKIGASWDVLPVLRIRLSESHDIRAPNHRELYYGQVFTPGSFFGFIQPPFSSNPWTNTTAPDPVSATLFGGARSGVLPEEADTTTIGFVIQPQDSNVRLAIDYFDITLENSIAPANLSITIQGCFLGIQSYCDQITDGITTPWQNPALDHNGAPTPGAGPKDSIPCPATCFTNIENYFSQTFNAGTYEVKGIDLTFDWLKELDNGSLMLRFLGTRTLEQNVTIVRNPLIPLVPTNIAGTVGNAVGFLSDYASAADFTGNLTATWTRGNFSLTGQMRYVDDGIIARDRIGPDDAAFVATAAASAANGGRQSTTLNALDSYEVYTVSGSYDFQLQGGNGLQVWGSINNLTDEDPPLYGTNLGGGTNAIFYNTAGREYRMGLRMNF
jgi:outer membrane receptor protein involved in Fe transport